MSHRSNAADIYGRVGEILEKLISTSDAMERSVMVDQVKCLLSDYSWERYAAGRDEEKLESVDPRAAYEAGRRAYCPASILVDTERTEREWLKAQAELKKKTVETSR